MISCEICDSKKDIDIYLGLNEILFLCESCIYSEEMRVGPE